MPETAHADAGGDLFEAITSGDLDRVIELLDKQPTLANHPNDGGISPLLMATYARRADIADFLLARGADLDLYAAAARGDAERVEALLAEEPTLATATSPDGWTALHLAAHFGHADVIALLLIRGAEVDARSTNALANTALHAALAGRHRDLAELLLANGADVNAQQHGGYTALHAAAQHGDLPLAQLLLQHGADPALRTAAGQSALSVADEHGHGEVVELLRRSAPID